MVELPYLTVVLVTLAAAFYCGERLNQLASNFVMRRISQRLRALEELHEATYREIRTEFDFWWSGEPQQAVKQAVIKQAPLPLEVIESMPPEMIDSITQSIALDHRDAALHLAVHARMAESEQSLMDSISNSQGLRDKIKADREDHENDLERMRTMLVAAGVDINDLEAHFSPEKL